MGVEESIGCNGATCTKEHSKTFVDAREELQMRRTTRFQTTEIDENYTSMSVKRRAQS